MLSTIKKIASLVVASILITNVSVRADIVVASAGPMTGDLAVFGEQLRYGAEMWEKDVNAKGGINGEKVKLEIGDDACDPKQAVAVANKLVGMGAVYVAGHFCSGSSIPASAVYSEAGVVQVSPASTNPKFTDEAKGDNVFRVCGRDDQQGEVAGAFIADKYDRGYGHFTTRQNIQFNWPKLLDIPEILRELSLVEMHAIQTSGNCIRNISSDHLAGLTLNEVEDPRPWCEIIRKWSTFHPEFSFLPRKFKIAVIGCTEDRAAMLVHDIGLRIIKRKNQVGFEIFVGGGQGRTPIIGKKIRDFLPKKDILNYLEAILTTYNQEGRRDNIYKARIKI